jgi:Arm DNA-binding domain
LVFLLVSYESQQDDTNMLNDTRVRNTKPCKQPIKLSDSGGLYLLIQPHGSKLWRLAYRFGGKQKTLAIGIYPTITLKYAREKRDEAKRHLADNIDPSTQRRLEKLTAASGNTFRAVAEEVLLKLEKEGRADVTLTKKRWLLDFAYPAIGERTANVSEETPGASGCKPLEEIRSTRLQYDCAGSCLADVHSQGHCAGIEVRNSGLS